MPKYDSLVYSSKLAPNLDPFLPPSTNKLVDGCYSFWVGALFPLVEYAKAAIEQKRSVGQWGTGAGYFWLA